VSHNMHNYTEDRLDLSVDLGPVVAFSLARCPSSRGGELADANPLLVLHVDPIDDTADRSRIPCCHLSVWRRRPNSSIDRLRLVGTNAS
jgi:hypothetical protein